MISFKNDRKKSTLSLKIIVVGILISSSLTEPSFANGVNNVYEDTWQNISGSLTADDALERRFGVAEGDPVPGSRLVDNYELFDVPADADISIYIKGNPNNDGTGLCDPAGLIYDVREGPESAVEFPDGRIEGGFTRYFDDGGAGGDADLYNGRTCSNTSEDFFDTFFTVSTVGIDISNYRLQVTSYLPVDPLRSGLIEPPLTRFNSGTYTLYVSVGRAVLTSNISSDNSPWVSAQSVTCPAPNPWIKEQLGFASDAKPVFATAENTVGKTITPSAYDSLNSSGVVFDTVSKKVSTATETLPLYGCKDRLLSGKVNQPIQFIAGGYTLQSDAHGYINTADLKWHDTNSVTLYTNTAAFMHTIKFTKKGKYVVVLTEQPDTSRGLIPTYGVRSIRFVININ